MLLKMYYDQVNKEVFLVLFNSITVIKHNPEVSYCVDTVPSHGE